MSREERHCPADYVPSVFDPAAASGRVLVAPSGERVVRRSSVEAGAAVARCWLRRIDPGSVGPCSLRLRRDRAEARDREIARMWRQGLTVG
jgi:hypothetical protein